LLPDTAADRIELNKLFGPHTVNITEDINAKSRLWGSPVPDECGLMFEELVDINNASVINTGQPTYQHYNGSRSHLDISSIRFPKVPDQIGPSSIIFWAVITVQRS